MKTIILIVTVILLFVSCSKESIRGSGNTITEARTVAAFTAVQIQGSAKVTIVQGTQKQVEVTGYENLVPIYETNVQNGTLILKFKSDYYNIQNNNISVNITTSALTRIGIEGSGQYTIRNFSGENFTGAVNGSGEIYSDNCTYNNSTLTVNGSGYIRAEHVQSKVADVEINGSGKIDVTCTENLKATIHGSGEINYWGNPATVTTNVSGSGRVRKK